MDPSNHSPADELVVVHRNGVHKEPYNSGKGGVVSNEIDHNVAEITDTVALNGNVENAVQLGTTSPNDSSSGEIKEGSIDNVDSSSVTISKVRHFLFT